MCNLKTSDGVSLPVKYMLFFFNFAFWVIGCVMVAIGTWAYSDKNRFEFFHIDSIYDILFDMSLALIVVGSVVFLIGFAGCLGAIRENIFLLTIFSYLLGILFIVEVVIAVLLFVYSTQSKTHIVALFRDKGIARYREDADMQHFFDFVQDRFECCGAGWQGYMEWSKNPYFNCSDANPSPERCSVPYSCCRRPNDVEAAHKNLMCGYGAQELERAEANKVVYTMGCVESLIRTAHQHMHTMGAMAIVLAIPQLGGIFLVSILIADIEELRDTWV